MRIVRTPEGDVILDPSIEQMDVVRTSLSVEVAETAKKKRILIKYLKPSLKNSFMMI